MTKSLITVSHLLLLFFLPLIVAESQGQTRIAILGCHRQYEPSPALHRYVQAKPDVSIWVGDNVYADTEDDPEVIKKAYAQLEAKPAFRELRDQSIFLVTWDDHDFGLNNAGQEYQLKGESKQIFREFWGLRDEIEADQDGVYYAKMVGDGDRKLQVILLDVRYNRDQPHSGGDVLGEEQWAWFEKQLTQPATLRFIVSGSQVLLEAEASSSETWDQYPDSRQRLFDTIKRTRAEGVVLITGDQHYAEVVRMPRVLDYDAIELQFASINQVEEPEFNPFRVSPVAQSLHSYALIDVQWEADEHDIPHLVFRVHDALDDRMELSYRINFSELERTIIFTEETNFVGSHTVTLGHPYSNLHVRYTVDGSYPGSSSMKYDKPITISQSTTIQAALFDEQGARRSSFQQREYVELELTKGIKPPEDLENGLRFSYAEGVFEWIPDFDSVSVVKKGIALDFDVEAIANREDHYAINYSGFVNVPTTGLYVFSTYSDDGSTLYIDGKLVVNNDGSHSAQMKSGYIGLEKGLHPLQLHYFEDYDGQVLKVFVKKPGSQIAEELAFNALFHR